MSIVCRSDWISDRRARLPLLVAALALGCGNRTDLPQETPGGIIPPTNTYTVKQVWDGFAGARDLVLTSGSQLYVAFPDSGRVEGFFSTGNTPRPNGKVLEGRAPTHVAEGVGRTLIVSDVDSTGAPVVRVFDQSDGSEVFAFADTAWMLIGGVAADDEGHIYVSDREGNRVRKYDAAGEFLLEIAHEGTGAGFVLAPDGLDWQPGRVLVVDAGKQWIQGLDPLEANHALFFLNGSDSPLGPFADLADVAGDKDGNLYIVDTANASVLKYDEDGEFGQRVEQNAPAGSRGHLEQPTAATANPRLVYVLDGAQIVTFELDL